MPYMPNVILGVKDMIALRRALILAMAAMPMASGFQAEAEMAQSRDTLVQGPSSLEIRDGWIRESEPFAKSEQLGLTIVNGNAEADVLLEVSSPAFDRVTLHNAPWARRYAEEIHGSTDSITIPSRQQLILGSFGPHLEAQQLLRRLSFGEQVPVTLKFKNSGSITSKVSILPK